MPFRAAETGAAFVAIAAERWLLGPEGTGALWVARGQDVQIRAHVPRKQ